MKYVVARVDEIPPGGRKIVEVAGRSIGLFNLDGEFYALRNRCPHQGGPLCQGLLLGIVHGGRPGEFFYEPRRAILACPWHGWEFDIRTGQSLCDPVRLRTRRYPVSVESGQRLLAAGESPVPSRVRGPYVAETYPVSVEGLYLVVEVPD